MKKLLILLSLLIAVSCSDDNNNSVNAPIIQENSGTLGVLMTDFASNTIANVDFTDSSFTLTENDINISNDPKAFSKTTSANGSSIFVLSRTATNSSVILLQENAVVQEKSLTKTNPHDISFYKDAMFITMYNDGLIYKLNYNDLSIIDSIIIPTPSDTSNPAPSGSVIVDNQLFVALQFQKNWAPNRNGQILIIDTETNTITDSINLPLKNPSSDILVSSDKKSLFVSCSGTFMGDGGVVKIDLATKTATKIEEISPNTNQTLVMDENDNLYYTAGYYGAYTLNKFANGVESILNPAKTKGVASFSIFDDKIFVGYSAYNQETYSFYKPELSMLSLDGIEIYSDSSLTIPVYDFVR